jgi:hypothetical protein
MQARTNAWIDPSMDWSTYDTLNTRTKNVKRVEVIVSGPEGRAYVNMNCNVSLHLQDDGKTLKIFVEDSK